MLLSERSMARPSPDLLQVPKKTRYILPWEFPGVSGHWDRDRCRKKTKQLQSYLPRPFK